MLKQLPRERSWPLRRPHSSSASCNDIAFVGSSYNLAAYVGQTVSKKGENAGERAEQNLQKQSPRKWMVLTPVPGFSELAQALGQNKQLTAIKWVTRCCPDLAHGVVERLFRLRQVKLCLSVPETGDFGSIKLKRIGRKEILSEGAVIHLPRSVSLLVSSNESDTSRVTGDPETQKGDSFDKKEYKPSPEDIEWAQELILHKDTHIIAINKPPGLAVQGGSGVGRNLNALLGPAFSFDFEETPKLVHRLDKDTSGVLVIGRTPESTTLLHSFFRMKTERAITVAESDAGPTVKRKYWALVIGVPGKREGVIKAPLRKVVLDGGKTDTIIVAERDAEDAVEAVTEYRVLGHSIHGCTWLQLHPLTGRRHQIRVHCAQVLGMPIVGDTKYGRTVHDEWRESRFKDNECVHPETKLQKDAQWDKSKTVMNSSTIGDAVEGSVTSKTPFLHLHSRLLVLPRVKELAATQTSGTKSAFADSLRLVAPLPPHMKASWDLLPPRLKGNSQSKAFGLSKAKNEVIPVKGPKLL